MGDFTLATIRAETASCWVTGAAWEEPGDNQRSVFHYVSLIGPPSQVTSVWASLVKRKGGIRIQDWNGYDNFTGMAERPARRMVKLLKGNPKYIHTVVYCPHPSLILLTAPGKAFPYNDAELAPVVGPRLAAYVNAHSRAICRREWGVWLYMQTLGLYRRSKVIKRLSHHGDCLAYLVPPGLAWEELIAEGVKKGELQ